MNEAAWWNGAGSTQTREGGGMAAPTRSSGAPVDSAKRRTILGAIAGAAMSGPGCASIDQPKRMSWKEEVQLHDGRVIVVEQSREIEWRYNGNNVGPLPVRSKLQFSLPNKKSEPVVYEGEIQPFILNVFEQTVYLAGWPLTEQAWWNRFDSPRSSWVAFILGASKQWSRIKPREVPEPIRTSNLFRGSLPLYRPANLPRADGVLVTLGYKAGEGPVLQGAFAEESQKLNPDLRAGWAKGFSDRGLGE